MKQKKGTYFEVIERRYKWRGGGGFNGVPAEVVGKELERIEVSPGDFHKTDDVLDAARHPDNPLHGCFTWEDEKAAELHRKNECRSMLRSIAYVIVRGDKRETRPVYLHITDSEGPKYVRSDRVAQEADLMRDALDEALALLNGIRRRFEFISELAPVFNALDSVKGGKKRKRK